MPRSLAVLVLLVASSEAFFFGSSGGCGCAAAPACPPPPPPPVCAPPPAPSCPPPSGCGGSYPVPAPAPIAPAPYPAPSYAPISQPANAQTVFVDRAPAAYQSAPLPPPPPPPPTGGYAQSPAKRETVEQNFDEAIERTHRVKRDSEQAFDPKCNSEELKNIIIKNIHENTATAKRNIQTAAANEIGGRIDVICSKGTFSYIVNTELYCETAVDGTTCFAFRQSS